MSSNERTYLDVRDTAKLIRKAVKEAFAGVKFSVRLDRYAGGSSIDVRWTDGPSVAMVKSIVDRFAGAYFDGMTDYKGSRYAYLDGKPVHFGGDFIFTHREYTDAAIEYAIGRINKRYNENVTLADYKAGRLWGNLEHVGRELNAFLSKYAWTPGKRSATAERVTSGGDDGYGHGTSGSIDENGNAEGGDRAAKGREELLERRAAAKAAEIAVEVHGRDLIVTFPEDTPDEERERFIASIDTPEKRTAAVKAGRLPLLALVVDNTKAIH